MLFVFGRAEGGDFDGAVVVSLPSLRCLLLDELFEDDKDLGDGALLLLLLCFGDAFLLRSGFAGEDLEDEDRILPAPTDDDNWLCFSLNTEAIKLLPSFGIISDLP